MSKATQNKPIEAEMDEIDPSEMWTPEERDEYFAEMEDSPLLMDKVTDVYCLLVLRVLGRSKAQHEYSGTGKHYSGQSFQR